MQACSNISSQPLVSLTIRRIGNNSPLHFLLPSDTKIETLRELIEIEAGKTNPLIPQGYRYRFDLNIKGNEEFLRNSEQIGSLTDSKTESVFLNMYPRGPYYYYEAYFNKMDEEEKRKAAQTTLLELFKDFSEKVTKSEEFSNEKVTYEIWSSSFLRKIEKDPGILDKLDIGVTAERMREIYEKHGIIVLREPIVQVLDLLLFCGNGPVYSSVMNFTYGERDIEEVEFHLHKRKTTVDFDPLMNPCLVAVWPSRNLISYLSQFHIRSLEGDVMDPIGTLLKNEKELESGLSLLAEILPSDGKAAAFRFNKPLKLKTDKEEELTGDFDDPLIYEDPKNLLGKVTWHTKTGEAFRYARKLNEPFIDSLASKASDLGFYIGISKEELSPFPSLHLSYDFYFIKK